MNRPTKKRSSIREQVSVARKVMRTWPLWMREICRIEGTNAKERRI